MSAPVLDAVPAPESDKEVGRPPAVVLAAAVTAAAIVLIALLGPLLAPGSPTAQVGMPFLEPSAGHPLGTDVLGRDVLTRLLHGGWVVVGLAVGATALATVIGAVVGVLAAMAGRRRGELAVRVLDLIAVMPPLLLLMVLATGFPGSDLAILVAIGVTTAPFSVRVVRAAATEVVGRGYVEAALARGDSRLAVVARDVAPNIAGPVLADVGLRFVAAVYLCSTAGFLGLGRGAPYANWGRMVAENIEGSALTVWPFVAPALVLVLFVVAINVLADALSARISGGSS